MSFFQPFDRRRVFTVVAVLLLAFLTGHLMQTLVADKTPVAVVKDAPDAAPILRQAEEPRPLPTPPAATLVPILDRPPILPDRTAADERQTSARQCEARLFATPAAAAMVIVRLRAPCNPGAKATIRQGPIVVTGRTDRAGDLTMRLPAFETEVAIAATISGIELETAAKVPDAEDYQRVALTWTGRQDLRLNAFEFGAARNETGHVWAGAPKSPVRGSRGSGGFLTRLISEDGPSAEIYSFPKARPSMRGVVRLRAEVRVTAENCGQVVRAKAFQPTAFRRLSMTDVEVALPDCDRLGDVVVLQNLLRDVRLAGR